MVRPSGPGRRLLVSILVALTLAPLGSKAITTCPESIQTPCTCTITREGGLSVICQSAESVEQAVQALGAVPPLERLEIVDTPIPHLSGFVFSQLSVRSLVLRNSDLSTIHVHAFDGPMLEGLMELELRGGRLEIVPQTGVPSLRSLRALTLADNRIQHVADNAFLSYRSRMQIQRLDLSSNNISHIQSQGFLGLESLEQLVLDNNYLDEVPTESLRVLGATLEDLSLAMNRLSKIESNAFPLPGLKSLSLEVNKISEIPADAFQESPALLYLYLADNQFSAIEPTTFFYVNQLKVLVLSRNPKIGFIDDTAFQYLPLLVRLELADCTISQIAASAFHKLPRIQVILLGGNRIVEIDSSTFAALPTLSMLDLHGNALASVADYAFAQLPQLRQLDLSANNLETMPAHVLFDSMKVLAGAANTPRSLHLHDNPWRCDAALSPLRQWLRDNGDVQTSKPDGPQAKCWMPAQLAGFDLRQPDPVSVDALVIVPSSPSSPSSSSSSSSSSFSNTKTNSNNNDNDNHIFHSFMPTTIPAIKIPASPSSSSSQTRWPVFPRKTLPNTPSTNNTPLPPFVPSRSSGGESYPVGPEISAVHIVLVVTGGVLTALVLAMTLLVVARHVSTAARRRREEDRRRLGGTPSTASSLSAAPFGAPAHFAPPGAASLYGTAIYGTTGGLPFDAACSPPLFTPSTATMSSRRCYGAGLPPLSNFEPTPQKPWYWWF